MKAGVELTSYPGLDGRITVLRAGTVVDAVFVRTARFDVLVDTLETPDNCRSALDQLGVTLGHRPLLVVNSHMDWDHFWGNAAVAGQGLIIAHERARQRFHAPSTREVLDRKAQQEARFAGLTLVEPTMTFSDGLILHVGDLTLHLFPTPGHTPDHLAVWIPEVRVCLAVDAVERPIPEVWSDDPADLRALRASLEAIRRLEAEHVVLAHGHTSSPEVVNENIRYFDALANAVRAHGAGLAVEAAILPGGLRLRDFVTMPDDLDLATVQFYERCHRSNLRATVRAAREVETGRAPA